MDKPLKGLTLGQYLEHSRQQAGLSLRQLAAASGVHPSSVNRLLHDVRASDLFLLAGLPIPRELPSVDVMLRAEYGLSEQGLAEAKRQIAAIAEAEAEAKSADR